MLPDVRQSRALDDDAHLTHLRARVRPRATGWRISADTWFAFGVSLIWLAVYNVRFWTEVVHAMWHGTLASAAFLISLSILALSLQALLLLLLPLRRLMIGAASACFLIAATSSYFTLEYGVLMNPDMLRNMLETEPAEVRSLLSGELAAWVIVLGIVPAALVWKVPLRSMRWTRRLADRARAIIVTLIVCTVALLSCSASYAVFFREHKPIRFMLMPAAPLTSALGAAFEENTSPHVRLIDPSGAPQRTTAPRARPLAIVVVIGETARAANFELGGYARRTNPELAATDGVVYFPETSACGTSTAISVPCMFSHLPGSKFHVAEAARYTNLLDALVGGGVHVEWRDNNAGCKGVCARVPTTYYRPEGSPGFCPQSYCYDEVLLQDLPAKLAALQSDAVLILHQIGSHGPAYAERYPPEFERFKPACHSNELQRCSSDEILNAYDNTIAYTDHVLARTIRLLRDAADDVDAMLLYVSDHGESLGEQGLYLHGLPYAFAPHTQTQVPMLMWLSPGYAARQNVLAACVQAQARAAFSHDNVYHTILGAAEVINTSYDRKLDILAPCRRSAVRGNHE